ncbi:hypothetical protein DFAR_3130003 [Desulfarculales bacterium]
MATPVILHEAGAGRNQALRTALSLCALAGRPLLCRGLMDNPRPAPGLGPGHQNLAMALATVTGGAWQADLGEEQMAVEPGQPQAGDYTFNMSDERQSAAPLSWFLETLLLPLAAAPGPSSLYLGGGTHVMGGSTSDEIREVLTHDWRLLGLDVGYTEITPGFYPEGGGEAEARVEPCPVIQPLVAEEAFVPVQVGLEVPLGSAGAPGRAGPRRGLGSPETAWAQTSAASARPAAWACLCWSGLKTRAACGWGSVPWGGVADVPRPWLPKPWRI